MKRENVAFEKALTLAKIENSEQNNILEEKFKQTLINLEELKKENEMLKTNEVADFLSKLKVKEGKIENLKKALTEKDELINLLSTELSETKKLFTKLNQSDA